MPLCMIGTAFLPVSIANPDDGIGCGGRDAFVCDGATVAYGGRRTAYPSVTAMTLAAQCGLRA
jgi:hypothetical protein